MKNYLMAVSAIATMMAAPFAMAEVSKVLTVDATGEQITSDSAGRYIYVADQKNDSLVIIDSSTLLVKETLSLPGNPEDVALDESAGKIYVTISDLNQALSFNINSLLLEDPLNLPQAGNEIVVGDNYIYVTTYASGSGIMRVDKNTGNYVDSFALGVSTYSKGAVELTPDKTKLVFANRGLSPGTVAIYDITGSSPILLIKNDHGALGSNGQNLSVDPIDGAFFSYAVGGGNGVGYTVAKVSIDDMSWAGEMDTGAYPRAVHYSVNGITAYTNNSLNELKVWDHTLLQLTGTIDVNGNPKGFSDAQNGALLAVISDQEFAIYQVGEFTPEPPAPEFSGFINGTVLTNAICYNKDTRQKVKVRLNSSTFDCAEAGLVINSGDRVRVTLHGDVVE